MSLTRGQTIFWNKGGFAGAFWELFLSALLDSLLLSDGSGLEGFGLDVWTGWRGINIPEVCLHLNVSAKVHCVM